MTTHLDQFYDAADTVEIELYPRGGGPRDGEVWRIDRRLHESEHIVVPIQRPDALDSLWESPTPTRAGYDRTIYRWDGTVSEQGRRRYRET